MAKCLHGMDKRLCARCSPSQPALPERRPLSQRFRSTDPKDEDEPTDEAGKKGRPKKRRPVNIDDGTDIPIAARIRSEDANGRRYETLEEAAKAAQQLKGLTRFNYLRRYKEDSLLPGDPKHYYGADEWESLGDWDGYLGTLDKL